MKNIIISILFLSLYSCGSRKDGTVSIKNIQGVSVSSLQGGVVLIGTDSFVKLHRTFLNGNDFINSELIVPGDREWEFKVFAWEGTGIGNDNFKGKIRCGFVRKFVKGGDHLAISVDLRNSECFDHVMVPPSQGGSNYFTLSNGIKSFKPIRVIGCNSTDFDFTLGASGFPSSNCYTAPAFGVTRSYRVVIPGKGIGQSGVGEAGLFSACIAQNIIANPNEGASFDNLNLPVGYNIHPNNLLIPLDLPIYLEAYTDNICTNPSLKTLKLENGVSDTDRHFFEPGKQLLKSLVNTAANYVNFVFEDEVPSAGQNGAFVTVNHSPFFNFANISGNCAPDGATVELFDVQLSTVHDTTICSSGSFTFVHGLGEGNYNFSVKLFPVTYPSGSFINFPFPFRFDSTASTNPGISVGPPPPTCAAGVSVAVSLNSACTGSVNHGGPFLNEPANTVIMKYTDSSNNLIAETTFACDGSTVSYQLNSNLITCTSTHKIKIYIQDAAGNISTASTHTIP